MHLNSMEYVDMAVHVSITNTEAVLLLTCFVCVAYLG
jgi:hypothetical protein